MVAVSQGLSSPALRASLIDGGSDAAMEAAADLLGAGAEPMHVVQGLLAESLDICALEAAGASWSHALLSVGATAGLLTHWGPELVQPAVVGAAGFLAHARPTRARPIPDQVRPWPGTPQWLDFIRAGDLGGAVAAWRGGGDEHGWRRASLMTSAGWGHQAIVGGRFARMGALFPGLAEDLRVAAIAAWIPLEIEGEVHPREESALEVVVAALELLRRAPDLRAVHGVTYAREVLAAAQAGPLEAAEVQRVASFVHGGWERARRDRRLRGDLAHYDPARLDLTEPAVDWPELIGELCRTELRPGFGHNVKIAETCTWLAGALPARYSSLALAALAATVSAWTRSRRPALVLRRISARAGGV